MTPLRAALFYASWGWHVFPVRPGAKVPATQNGCLDATTNRSRIENWWGRTPDANVGVATGPSGLCVVDLDSSQARQHWEHLASEHGGASTKMSRTPRGWHLWFLAPEVPLRNSASRLAEGIDVRGEGGYVVAPPSVRPEGAYAWLKGPQTVSRLPEWVEVALRPLRASHGLVAPLPNPFGDDDEARPHTKFDTCVLIAAGGVAMAQPGERNTELNRKAYWLFSKVETDQDLEDAWQALTYTGLLIGLEAREVEATLDSAWRSRQREVGL